MAISALWCTAGAWADPPQLELTHEYLSFTPTDAGVSGAEYRFTIRNRGDQDLYDLRIALGVGAPEPVEADGQPTLRLASLEVGETRTVVYTVTVREPSEERVRSADLVGWVEAVADHGGPIVNAGVVSRLVGDRR